MFSGLMAPAASPTVGQPGGQPGYDCPEEEPKEGARTLVLTSYDLPKFFYGSPAKIGASPAYYMAALGCLIWYGDKHSRTGRKARTPMDVDAMVTKWKRLVVALATAHDKDEADRVEATVEECLSPILAAPIKQVREFAPKLLAALKADKSVPFIIWRAYEVWILQMKNAPDEDIKELKTGLAREIVELVESDVKPQLGEAMIRALQWRSPEQLEKMKEVVEKEHAAGRPARLKGRESCIFLESGGTEDNPEVCVQI